MKLYSELAEYYFDIEKNARKFEMETQFIDRLFRKHRVRNILDLGCGTGEHVTHFQSLGYKSRGIDSSIKMIEVAKKRYSHCKFEVGAMQSYKSQEKWDAIISLFGSFNYLLSNEEVEAALKNLEMNLKPAGIAVLEVWNAEPLRKIKRKAIGPVAQIKAKNTTIQRNRGFRLVRADQSTVVEVNYIYNLNAKEIKDKHLMRAYFLVELQRMLAKHRMEILHVYSNYSELKFKSNASRMILVLKKKSN
ncbi:SAM-dependent methyltransferase [Leptospira hartskeerlii]|uniref:SAM-dependent methyltransferase n=1 Tax=Leptospira hartskeerlii TaxID=2023177 RepID=A0A2M9X9X5_9LEPT|nr:class I SAM-dependent methyltransferase [Leptospira hartskeerlii]PJZ24498.1 SAM-dependent methyltransferase [Leptospira hartskeerlii]PJZ32890.1 SAM-dependent methyltransferase [Leptospira hartskeerlii]